MHILPRTAILDTFPYCTLTIEKLLHNIFTLLFCLHIAYVAYILRQKYIIFMFAPKKTWKKLVRPDFFAPLQEGRNINWFESELKKWGT